MKYSLLVFIFFSATVCAADKQGLGAGIGSMYAGSGINLAFKTNNYLQYNAIGCKSFGFGTEEGVSYSEYKCGIGVGLVAAGIIPRLSNNSSLDFHLGVWQKRYRNSTTETQYEYGVGYLYFKNGLYEKGPVFGITPVYEKREFDSDIKYHFTLGYQFK